MPTNKPTNDSSSAQLDSTVSLDAAAHSSNPELFGRAARREGRADRLAEDCQASDCVAAALEGAATGDRFAIDRLHATGGTSRIWLAHDAKFDRHVALKELRPELADNEVVTARFNREAKITGQLEHPGIVPIYELGLRGETQQPFYTMRFVKGRTLSEASEAYHQKRKADEAGPVDLLQLLNAFVTVCKTVAYAHSRGVVHRDLKGANVILGDFGEVIVVDWGLAKLCVDPGENAEPLVVRPRVDSYPCDDAVPGHALGTPAYMSPEQAAGLTASMDRRTDVYGLGAILYEILTGVPPFLGSSLQDIMRKVEHEPPVSPRELSPGIPKELEDVCLRALAKLPSERYDSATELADKIQNWLAVLAEEPLRRMAASERQAQQALRKVHDQQRALIEVIRSQSFQSPDLVVTLRRLTEIAARTLKVDRVGIWRYDSDRSGIHCVDLYERDVDRHSSGLELKASRYPSYFRSLAESEVIAAHDARSDPRTREFANGYLDELRICSMLDAPIHLFGELDGVLCHEHVGRAREWTAEEQLFGIALSNLVSLAIEQWERRRGSTERHASVAAPECFNRTK